jgi:hypothetical protein
MYSQCRKRKDKRKLGKEETEDERRLIVTRASLQTRFKIIVKTVIELSNDGPVLDSS